MKVYCKDCKYYEDTNAGYRIYQPANHICNAEIIETIDTWFRQKIIFAKPQDKNKNNDCKDFEKKKWYQ
jgi:hypothetical protein